MTGSGSYSISLAGKKLLVVWKGKRSLDILTSLYGAGVHFSSHEAVGPHFRISAGKPEEEIELYRGDRLLYLGPSEGAAAEILLDSTAHDLAYSFNSGPLLHAAAVSRNCCGILMPGDSGSGKSTLVAWLASKGWNYLTDEMAGIETGTRVIHGLYRSLHLRTPVWAFLGRVIYQRGASVGRGGYRTQRGFIVPIETINPGNTCQNPILQLIIFPKYVQGVRLAIGPLSIAQTTSRLMGCLVNVRNLPDHGLSEIVRLARETPAYALTYGKLDRVSSAIETLLDRSAAESRIKRDRANALHS